MVFEFQSLDKSLFTEKTFSLVIHPFYKRYFSDEFEKFKTLFSENEINTKTIAHFARLWIRNYLINIELLKNKKNYTFLTRKTLNLKNKPILFLGASPILEEQIEWILKHREEYFIICSDTCSAFAQDKSIVPNLILSVDSGRGTIYHFRENLYRDIPVLTWLGANSEIFRRENPLVLFATNFPLDQILNSSNPDMVLLENPSLNVSGIAKSISLYFNASILIYAGIGFRSVNGKTHCRGTGYESYYLDKTNRKKSLELLSPRGYREKVQGKNSIAMKEILDDSKIKVVDLSEKFPENLDKLENETIKFQLRPEWTQFERDLKKPVVLSEIAGVTGCEIKLIKKYLKINPKI